MTTSPHRADSSWSSPEQEFDLLVQEHPAYIQEPVVRDGASPAETDHRLAGAEAHDSSDPLPHTRVGEYVAMPGLPARGVVLISLLAVAGCAGIDLLLTSAITMFFDLCFIVVCLVSAMAVRRRDFFTAGVLPPLVFAAVVAVLAARDPATFVTTGGMTKAFMTGLAEHATALVVGYAIVLATLAGRLSAARTR